MFAAIARFAIRFRWLIVAVWLIGGVAGARLLPNLASVNTFNVQLLPTSSPSQQANQLAVPFQGSLPSSAALNPPSTILIAQRTPGPLSAADNAAISQVEQQTARLAGVSLVRDEGISADGKAREALVVVQASAAQNETASENIVSAIRASEVAAGAPAGLSFHLTGPFAASVDALGAHPANITVVTILFLIVLLFVVYRALLAPLLTLLPTILSLLLAEGLVAELVKAGLLSAILVDLLIILLLGAGTDYGLFLAFRFREELLRETDPHKALVAAMSGVGKVISYSAFIVALSLFLLLLAPFGIYRGFGPAFAIGVGVLLASSLTLTPALLAIFGRAAFWPSHSRPGKPRAGGIRWGWLTERVVRHPVVTLLVGMVLFSVLGTGLVGYQTSDFLSTPPAGSDSAAGAQVLTTHFPAANPLSDKLLLRFGTSVWDDPALLTEAQTRLADASVFEAISGPLGPGHGSISAAQLAGLHASLGPALSLSPTPPTGSQVAPELYQRYQRTAQFISPDGRTVQYYAVLRAGAVGSSAASSAIPQAQAALASVARTVGAQVYGVAGPDADAHDIASVSTLSTAVVVPLVLMLILLLLALLLRSLVAPWYLALTVGLSYLAALGFAMLVFVHLGNADGLLFVLPLLLFIFSMAIGEDYNILVMSRIREEAGKQASLREAVIHAVNITGPTVTSAGIILAGTFLVLGLAGGSGEDQQLGFSIAFGVALDTFFVRTLLVPAIAVLLGRWNWWPAPLFHHRNNTTGETGKTAKEVSVEIPQQS
jgi:RND superfamily putative drug exporter